MNRSLYPSLLAVCLLTWTGVSAFASGTLDLFRDGQSDYRILTAVNPTPGVEMAAQRLQSDLAKSTGFKLPIINDDEFDQLGPGQKVIALGATRLSGQLGIDAQAIPHDGYRLQTHGEHLLIVGNDSGDSPIMDRLHDSNGTYIGVGRFLHKHVGIVQYLPGQKWQHVPQLDDITVEIEDETISPSFKNRRISLNYIVRGDPLQRRWSPRRRAFLQWARLNGAGDGVLGFTAHEVDDIMKPYSQNGEYTGKREWVALYDGRRLAPRDDFSLRTWYRYHLCTSNEEVRQITMDYIDRFFEERPDFEIVGISMTDGDRYCECGPCRAQDAPGTDSKTDRFVNFANDIARRAAEKYPDKLVAFFIYAAYVETPKIEANRAIEDNLHLFFVSNGTYYFSREEKAKVHRDMAEWAKLSDKIVFYSWPQSHGFLGLPLSDPQWVIDNTRFMKERGYWGYKHLVLGSVHARQPESYLWTQLTYDVDQDPEQLLAEYYADLYGDAADYVRRYHQLLAEHVYQANEEIELEKDQGDDTVRKYEDRLLAYFAPIVEPAGELLKQADEAVAGDDIRRKRVRVLMNQLKTADIMVEAVQIGKRMDRGQASRQELRRLDRLRIDYHEHLRRYGNTDVLDVRDIEEVPSYGRDDLMRYLLIPKDYGRWFDKPIEKRPSSKWQDLAFEYVRPAAALEGELIAALPKTWDFKLMPGGDGREKGLAQAEPDDTWQRLRIDKFWRDQGIDARDPGWYTTEFTVPADAPTDGTLWLLFKAVDGNAHVWIDGQPAGEQTGPVSTMWNRPWALDVTDKITPGKTHRFTIRVEKVETAGVIGIYKPIEIRASAGEVKRVADAAD